MKKYKIALGIVFIFCLSGITPLLINGTYLDDSTIQQNDSISDENNSKGENAGPFWPDPPIGTITVIKPDNSSYWAPGNTYEVKWEWTGNFDTVIIALDTQQGYHSMPSVLTSNDGSYFWHVPYELILGGNDFRIYVAAFNQYYPDYIYDYSDYFSVAGYFPQPPESISISNPTSSTSWIAGTTYNIEWTYTGSIIFFMLVKIDLYKGGVFYQTIAGTTLNSGVFSWNIPAYLPSGSNYQIRIQKPGDPSVVDYSDFFSITPWIPPIPKVLFVTTPDSSSIWEGGSTSPISWISIGCSNSVDLQLWKGGSLIENIIIGTSNDGIYQWSIPINTVEGNNYRIKIIDNSDPSVQSLSSYFSIINPPGTSVLPTPNGTDVNITDADSGLGITFENITESGTTIIIESEEELESPSGFEVAGDYFDISTDAEFTGAITVAIPYNETQVQGNEKHLKLYHWENETGWTDVTTDVDTENNIIYGEITSFSIFIVLEPSLSWKLDQLKEEIQNSLEEYWSHPEDNRKSTIIEKLEELDTLISANELEEAYDKLLHDIKPKLTGLKTNENEEIWGNGVFKNPWVISSELNEELRVDCNDILSSIQIMINNSDSQ